MFFDPPMRALLYSLAILAGTALFFGGGTVLYVNIVPSGIHPVETIALAALAFLSGAAIIAVLLYRLHRHELAQPPRPRPDAVTVALTFAFIALIALDVYLQQSGPPDLRPWSRFAAASTAAFLGWRVHRQRHDQRRVR